MMKEGVLINIALMQDDEKVLDEEATKRARELLAHLGRRYGVSPMRYPVVYSLGGSRIKELTRFFVKNFLAWPLTAFKEGSPYMGVYRGAVYPLEEPSIVLAYGSSDLETLEHEVRHHFCYECRRRPYLLSGNAIDFLRDYYWESTYSRVARARLRRLRKSPPEGMDEERCGELHHVLEDLSEKRFPRSRYLPDAVAGIITEAHPWVGEGFAAEGSAAELLRVPLKASLAAASLGILSATASAIPSASPPLSLALGYAGGGILNVSYCFIRTMPLDLGVLRWMILRRSIPDADVPRVLAYPPTKEKGLKEVLRKIDEYSIFNP